MIKRFNEFNEEEQAYILKMNDEQFIAEMSDSYAITRKEEEEILRKFNEKFGYKFSMFIPDFYGNDDKIGFR